MTIQGLGRRRASRLGYTIDLEVIVVGDRKPLHTSMYDLAKYVPIIYHADVKSVWW